MSKDVLLSVRDLGVQIDQRWLLRGVSFDLRAGQSLTLVGESGAGKSLLAQAIMGNLSHALQASGSITVAGHTSRAAEAMARRALWGRALALLPQEPSLALDPLRHILPQLEEVHALVRGTDQAQARRDAVGALSEMGLEHASGLYPWQISGGMAQRAAAAVALAGGAPVLLVDEPTKGLDAHWCARMVALMQQVLRAGGCVVAITHDLRLAQALGGDMVVLREGEVVEQGSARQVLQAPAHPFTQRLIGASPARWAKRLASAPGAWLLQARGLRKAFSGRTLFDRLDLDIRQAERLVLQGPSGSGKSTLGNVLLGLLKPDAGTVTRAPNMGRFGCQKLYQDPVASFAEHISVGQSLRDVATKHGVAWPTIEALLERLRVAGELLQRPPKAVSGGELQRLALARVLAVKPSIILADEPTSRLDLLTQQHALTALVEAADDTGAGLVLVTHDEDIAQWAGTQRLDMRSRGE
jgi:peptide/nickel transport system ATP-binding protein